MPALDYEKARELLDVLFSEADRAKVLPIRGEASATANVLFSSNTQSYREVLLGCCLARLLDDSVNIRHPYMNQGDDAFNGRTLDERVVNPFFQDHLIPSSKGPYLASFRRSVKFVPETALGLRDKEGYAAFLAYLSMLESGNTEECRSLTIQLLQQFIALRDSSQIPLARILRLSLEQYGELIDRLLRIQSGGLLPVLIAVAMLATIRKCFSLPWEIKWQGINVADKASGTAGDVTVLHNGAVLLAIEVTERPIERSRVISTFNTKIVQEGIEDYLFIYSASLPTNEARAAAQTYFSQGHEINFLQIKEWVVHNLAMIGSKHRVFFSNEMLSLLGGRDIPASVKIAWNNAVKGLVEV